MYNQTAFGYCSLSIGELDAKVVIDNNGPKNGVLNLSFPLSLYVTAKLPEINEIVFCSCCCFMT